MFPTASAVGPSGAGFGAEQTFGDLLVAVPLTLRKDTPTSLQKYPSLLFLSQCCRQSPCIGTD